MLLLVSGRTGQALADSKEEYLLIERSFQDALYDLTINQSEQFIKKYPEVPELGNALLYQGKALSQMGKYKQAVSIFSDIPKKVFPISVKEQAVYWEAETYFKMNEYEIAADKFTKFYRDYPSSELAPMASFSVGWCMERLSDKYAAQKAFEETYLQFSNSRYAADAEYHVGRISFEMAEFGQAIETLERFLSNHRLHKKAPQAFYLLGESYFNLKEYPEAIENFRKVLNTEQKDLFQTYVQHGIAWSLFQLEQYEESLNAFNTHVLSAGNNPIFDSFLFGKARSLQMIGRKEDALKVFESVAKDFPESGYADDALFWQGEIYYEMGDYPTAIREWEQMLTLYSSSELREEAQYNLSWALFNTGDDVRAMEYLFIIKESSRNSVIAASAICRIGDVLIEKGKVEEAMRQYDTVLQGFGDTLYAGYAQYQLSNALMQAGNSDGAILGFRTLLKRYPTSLYVDDGMYALGYALMRRGEYVEAKSVLKDMTVKYPESPFINQAVFQIAVCDFNLKNPADALKGFKTVSESATGELAAMALYQCAIVYFQQGEDDSAGKMLDQMGVRYSDFNIYGDAQYLAAEHAFERGEYQSVLDAAKSFLKQFKTHHLADDITNLQAKAYYRLGDTGRALSVYESALAQFPNGDVIPDMIETYVSLAMSDDAASHAQNVLTALTMEASGFNKASAQSALGVIYRSEGQLDKALFYYRSALKDAREPLSAELQFRIADALEGQQKTQEAIAEYLKTGYLYPAQKEWVVRAYKRAAAIYESEGKPEEARILIDKAQDIT